MAKNWQYAARLLWPVLTTAAREAKTLTYSNIAPEVSTNARNVRRALGPIMHHCIDNHLPPLTSIVIGKSRGVPGQGFISWEIDDINAAHQAVYRYNWDVVANPFEGFDEEDTIQSLAWFLMNDPARSEEVYAKIRVRGPVQAIFRTVLLAAYDDKCSICGLSFKETLDAAHIIPWSKANPSQRISPRNGLLLCSNHHRLFDNGWIDISEDFVVIHNNKGWDEDSYEDADKAATTRFGDSRLRLPENKGLWPKRRFLRRRLRGDYN